MKLKKPSKSFTLKQLKRPIFDVARVVATFVDKNLNFNPQSYFSTAVKIFPPHLAALLTPTEMLQKFHSAKLNN
jgi:hypothetical protein